MPLRTGLPDASRTRTAITGRVVPSAVDDDPLVAVYSLPVSMTDSVDARYLCATTFAVEKVDNMIISDYIF